ncbi:MAG: glycosyltransferase family 2 protein, partial [Clostridia bacterium]|nr:glycosyltransferase family 2 protein [Clostridia bacterium]
MKLLIALPCLNEAENLRPVLERIPKTCEGIDVVRTLVVDDGSVDDTVSIAREMGVKVVEHRQNKGLGQAFLSAVDYALDYGYDVMVNMDGDGQFDPTDIQRLIDPILAQQADFVTGTRFTGGDRIEH